MRGKKTLPILLFTLLALIVLAADPSFVNVADNTIFNATEDAPFNFTIIATDTDAEYPLNYTHDAGSTNFTAFSLYQLNATHAVMNFTPTNNDVTPNLTDIKVVHITVTDASPPPFVEDTTITVYFNISNANDAPDVVNYTPTDLTSNGTENSSSSFWFDYNLSDIDQRWGDILTARWYVGGALNHTSNGSGGNFTYVLGFCEPRNLNVTLVASDLANQNDSVVWNVQTNNSNRLPSFNFSSNITNRTWQQDTNLTNNLTLDDYFSDADANCTENGDNVTFTVVRLVGSGNITVQINSTPPHLVSFIPQTGWNGAEVIYFLMNDTKNGTARSNNFTLNVTNQLDPPYFSPDPVGNYTAYVDAPFSLDVNSTDIDGDTLTYGDNTTLFAINTASGLISFTPGAGDVGNYTIALNVTDAVYVINTTINLTIWPNAAPNLSSIDNHSMTEGDTFTLNVSATDADNDNMSFSISEASFSQNSINATHKQFVWSNIPDSASDQNHSITVTVTDTKGAADSQVFILEVIGVNFAPILAAIPDVRVRANKTAQYTITASDPDGDSLDFSTNDSRVNLTALSSTSALLNFTHGAIETFNVNVSVNDTSASPLADWQVVLFNVTANHAPVVQTIGVLNATEDAPFLFALANFTSDEDNTSVYEETLTYRLMQVANQTHNLSNTSWITFSASTGRFSFYVNTSAESGQFNITFNVSDDQLTTNATFTLNITPVNDAPYFVFPPENLTEWQTVVEDVNRLIPTGATVGVLGAVNASDEEGNGIVFGVQFIAGPTNWLFNWTDSQVTNRRFINFTPRAIDVGNYTVNLTVSDASAWSGVLVNFTVQEVDDAPNISSVYPYGTPVSNATIFGFNATSNYPNRQTSINASEGMDLLFNHTTFDEENDTIYFTWWLDGVNVSSNESWTFTLGYSANTSYNITVTATDGTNSSSFMWNLTVSNTPLEPTFGMKRIDSQADFNAGNSTLYISVNTSGSITLNGSGNFAFNGTYLSMAVDLRGNDSDGFSTPLSLYNLTRINYSTYIPGPAWVTLEVRSSSDASSWGTWTNHGVLNDTSGSAAFSGTTLRYIQYRLNLSTNDSASAPEIRSIDLLYGIAPYNVTEGTTVPWWIDLDDFFLNPDPDFSPNYSAVNGTYLTIEVSSDYPGGNVYRLVSESNSVTSDQTTTVTFSATAGAFNASSNNAVIFIKNQPSTGSGSTATTSSSGGSSGSATVTEIVKPIHIPLEEFLNIDLLIPQPVTIYQNETILVPVLLRNNGNRTLYGIRMFANSNNSVASMSYTQDYFSELGAGQEVSTNLVVTSYTSQGTYEIQIVANITDPQISDAAVVLINSIEKGTYSPEELNTRIAFTRDLLAANPQCLELNELLVRAEQSLGDGELGEAGELLGVVLESCRYLVTTEEEAAPQSGAEWLYSRVFGTLPSKRALRYILYTLAAFGVLLLSVAVERLRLWRLWRLRRDKFKKKPKQPRLQSI